MKVLSAQGDGPVYLAALSGAKKPCVIKTLPLQGKDSVDLGLLKAETKKLARIHSAHLAAVHASPEVESDGAFVMEYVRGKSLAAVCQRAEDYAVLLPPELGLVVAHDVFAATEAFRAFEGANRVHGNISPRTILVGYSGDVKVAGYRPGVHATAGVDVHVARDLKPVASMLCDTYTVVHGVHAPNGRELMQKIVGCYQKVWANLDVALAHADDVIYPAMDSKLYGAA